jgi:hypothetical protein
MRYNLNARVETLHGSDAVVGVHYPLSAARNHSSMNAVRSPKTWPIRQGLDVSDRPIRPDGEFCGRPNTRP